MSDFAPADLSEEASALLAQSVGTATARAREQELRDFLAFAKGSVSPQTVASYLASRFNSDGWSTGRIEQARSHIVAAVQLTLNRDWSHHPYISRIVRACGRQRPKAARYSDMWDLRLLFRFYAQQPVSTMRVVARRKALCLVRASIAARCGDARQIARSSVRWDSEGVAFRFLGWKTQHSSGSSALSKPYRIDFLPEGEAAWCAARALQQYLTLNEAQYASAAHDLVWTAFNSAKPLLVGTIRSDCKKDMIAAGVPVHYGAASIRHAAISLWCSLGVSREEVAQRTGHRSLAVISFYYDKSQSRDLNRRLVDALSPNPLATASDDDDSDDSEEEF